MLSDDYQTVLDIYMPIIKRIPLEVWNRYCEDMGSESYDNLEDYYTDYLGNEETVRECWADDICDPIELTVILLISGVCEIGNYDRAIFDDTPQVKSLEWLPKTQIRSGSETP